jgi:AraC-like DNA-binding protein
MYAQQSLQDTLFLMFYGAVAILALVSGLYLWLRHSNAIAPDITPPTALRRWTAAFFITAALSHVWWYVLGIYWLTDDRLVRNITAVTLDHITLVPLVIALLLRMLQDRQRPLWPWVVSQVPILVVAAVGIVRHDEFYGFDLTTYWQIAVMILFVLYYLHALKQYGRWLRENYADLEHKEVWKSLLFMAALFVIYEVYFTNPGEMAKEYLAQIETLAIMVFLIWRIETLQQLDDKMAETSQEDEAAPIGMPSTINFQQELETCCEARQLYLLPDITLQQLAAAIGTNRTYLGNYFAQQGITYNAYINRLRIQHFMRIYRENVSSDSSVTATELARRSGFRSYTTFSAAFKQLNDQTVAAWMKEQII